jgi:xanthine dehydrogenase molybdenum-binding subunit
VRVLLSDTDLTPDGGPTTASRQTFVTGNAARLAARAMRQRLALVAAQRWDVTPESISFLEGELQAEGHVASFSDAVQWMVNKGSDPCLTYRYTAPETRPLGQGGDMHVAFSYGAQAAEVAVNERTGEVRVLRLLAACDVGRAINPRALVGQMEGAIMMALGGALTEEYVVEDGIPQTLRMADYKVPQIRDMPEMHLHVVEHPTWAGPYGAKGVGELPSIPTGPAICNGITNAVGVRVLRLPVRPGWLLEELGRVKQNTPPAQA